MDAAIEREGTAAGIARDQTDVERVERIRIDIYRPARPAREQGYPAICSQARHTAEQSPDHVDRTAEVRPACEEPARSTDDDEVPGYLIQHRIGEVQRTGSGRTHAYVNGRIGRGQQQDVA